MLHISLLLLRFQLRVGINVSNQTLLHTWITLLRRMEPPPLPPLVRGTHSPTANPGVSHTPRSSRTPSFHSLSKATAVRVPPRQPLTGGFYRGSERKLCLPRRTCIIFLHPLTRRNLSAAFEKTR